jgi:hypothetical protein
MKFILFVVQDRFNQPIIAVTQYLMGWLDDYPKLELMLVMFLIPVIMNALAFWIQDNYLMKKQPEYADGDDYSEEDECKL